MFGYIKTAQSELRLREYEYYRASYCGLCRAMGKCTGQCSRMLLSYDFAFLVNVRMALTGEQPTFKKRRCLAHPFHPRKMMEINDQLRYCADASAILAYEKCRDDVADERGFRRFKARLRRLFVAPAYRRARKRYPELAVRVRAQLASLSQGEREGHPSVDEFALIFGELLSEIVCYGLPEAILPIARQIGRQTGRFIYIVDAIDDLDEDARKKRFNPFLSLYGGTLSPEEKASVEAALVVTLSDMETALDLIDRENDPTRYEILKNILYLGMPDTVRRVLYGKKEYSKEEHLA